MFGGIGTGEILVLLVIALIVIGPQKLPQVARTIGRGLAELRRASYDLQRTLSLQDLDDAASKLPDPIAKDRLHEKTSAEHVEVSGTKGRSTMASLSPYDGALDHVAPPANAGGDSAAETGDDEALESNPPPGRAAQASEQAAPESNPAGDEPVPDDMANASSSPKLPERKPERKGEEN